jgi:hypothetical protein
VTGREGQKPGIDENYTRPQLHTEISRARR